MGLGNGSKKFRNPEGSQDLPAYTGPLLMPVSPQSYLGYVVRCYGKEIDLVRQPLGGLHCGNVGVDQQCLDVFLLQGLDCLGGQKWHVRLDNRSKILNSLRQVQIFLSLLSSLYS